jgi:hypothetical protein
VKNTARAFPALVAALISLAVVLAGVPAATAASAGTASENRAHARATKLLDEVKAALRPSASSTRHAARTTPLPRRDLTLKILQLKAARSALTPRQQIDVNTITGRPVPDGSGCSTFLTWQATATTHFCIHYETIGSDAADPAWVTQTGTTLEEVYAKEIGSMHYRAPLADADGLYDVFLGEIGDQGYYGFCTTDDDTYKSSAWCMLDNDFSPAEFGAPAINSLRVTAAHEFFHAIQFAYNAGQNLWFMEGTAVWMEDEVYPSINDYLQYLKYSAITYPSVSIDNNDFPWHYGAVLFWKYLAESMRNKDVIRQVWGYGDSAYGRNALGAVKTMIAAHGLNFGRVFAKFAAWNTKPNGSYADRAHFPAPGFGLVRTMRKVGADSKWLQVKLNHLASSPALIKPGLRLPRTAKLRISINGPSRAYGPQALVQIRMRSGAVRYVYIPLSRAGDGTQAVLFNPRRVRQIVLSPVNTGNANGKTFLVRLRVVR